MCWFPLKTHIRIKCTDKYVSLKKIFKICFSVPRPNAFKSDKGDLQHCIPYRTSYSYTAFD